jgi:hypothetical protein
MSFWAFPGPRPASRPKGPGGAFAAPKAPGAARPLPAKPPPPGGAFPPQGQRGRGGAVRKGFSDCPEDSIMGPAAANSAPAGGPFRPPPPPGPGLRAFLFLLSPPSGSGAPRFSNFAAPRGQPASRSRGFPAFRLRRAFGRRQPRFHPPLAFTPLAFSPLAFSPLAFFAFGIHAFGLFRLWPSRLWAFWDFHG